MGQKLSLADCTLVPFFFFVPRLFPALGRKNPLESRTNLREWWTAVQRDPNVARVVGEMDAALREMLSGGSPSEFSFDSRGMLGDPQPAAFEIVSPHGSAWVRVTPGGHVSITDVAPALPLAVPVGPVVPPGGG